MPESRITFSCESIPRADHLADVAAEYPISHLVTQINGNLIFQFDGEIRNAASRVNGAVRKDAVGGAGFDAERAGTAMVGDKGRIGFEREVEQDL